MLLRQCGSVIAEVQIQYFCDPDYFVVLVSVPMCDIFELLTLSLLQEMCSFWVLLCFNILFHDVGSMYTAIHKIIA